MFESPGPNPDWGPLFAVQGAPLKFIEIARTMSAEDLARVRFTARWLSDTWGIYAGYTYRKPCALKEVGWTKTPTPRGGAPKTKVFDGNSLLAWVDDLTRVKWGGSVQQDRTLYRMVKSHWAQYAKLADTLPFDAAMSYLRAYACMELLEEHFPGAPYTVKARQFMAQIDA